MKTVKLKTSDLIDGPLDWAVCIAKGINPTHIYISKGSKPEYTLLFRRNLDEDGNLDGSYTTGPDLLFSRKWESGGPIIDREEIGTKRRAPCMKGEEWEAMGSITAKGAGYRHAVGPTPLIAAMRCYVASKLGETVDVPEELTK